MKFELGRCLLQECMAEHGTTLLVLAKELHYKPERLVDYIENKRIMPLQVAISVAHTIGCQVNELYELIAVNSDPT